MRLATTLFITQLALLSAGPAIATGELTMPDGAGGIGFDDLRFDHATERLLVPAGRTGNLDVVDPKTRVVTPIAGFSRAAASRRGHGQGVTSADAGEGWLFAVDRTARIVAVVDPRAQKIVARAPLAGGPDYVRFVAPTHELWVTEPDHARIEVFALSPGAPPKPSHAAFIPTPGGPESLIVDGARARVYTHKWERETMAIDVRARRIIATWSAGCAAPRGIALDEARALLFVGCEEGKATVLDVGAGAGQAGRLVSSVSSGRGIDIIAYDPGRAHLYLPSEEGGSLGFVGVARTGALSTLGTARAVAGAHCATTDEAGHVYVCDPHGGRLLVIDDPYPRFSE